jgi:hypothetical protein
MAGVDWRLAGEWIKNCSCAFGCPCDFNAPPTRGYCKGFLGMRIRDGHFGEVRLDGISFFVNVEFPGPLHEGNGTVQPIIDERATQQQRDALFAIMSGQNSAEGTLFHIFSLIVTKIVGKMLDPIFAPIHVEFDMPGRRAKVSIPGVLESEDEPIKNPVTGAPHRIQLVMPEGFEHIMAEVCSSNIRSTGGIQYDVTQGHGSLATVVQTPQGVAA